MRKAGFIAASIGTAGLLAAGAAAIAHFAINANPVEEANASEIAPPQAAAQAPHVRIENPPISPRATETAAPEQSRSGWGVLGFALGDDEAKQERAAPPSRGAEQRAAPPQRSGDDDDDDDGDDD